MDMYHTRYRLVLRTDVSYAIALHLSCNVKLKASRGTTTYHERHKERRRNGSKESSLSDCHRPCLSVLDPWTFAFLGQLLVA